MLNRIAYGIFPTFGPCGEFYVWNDVWNFCKRSHDVISANQIQEGKYQIERRCRIATRGNHVLNNNELAAAVNCCQAVVLMFNFECEISEI